MMIDLSWLFSHQAQVCGVLATAASLLVLFVLSAGRTNQTRDRQKSLDIAHEQLLEAKRQLAAFLADNRVPPKIKARLATLSAVIMEEASCVDLIKKAHSEEIPDAYPQYMVDLQRIDPLLFDRFEDVVSTGLFAMANASGKVHRCLHDIIMADIVASSGRRRIIAASAPPKRDLPSDDVVAPQPLAAMAGLGRI